MFASSSNVQQASKDGKTAWKIRKQAIDEVDSALSKCSSLIDTSPECMKPLAELLRALRDRLSDSQGNLKPFSARVLGSFFSVTDAAAQAKFGKLVYAPLMNAAMTDIKKPMRDSSLEALRLSVTKPTIEGGGYNKDTLDSFMNSLSGEINETALKVRLRVSIILLASTTELNSDRSLTLFYVEGGRAARFAGPSAFICRAFAQSRSSRCHTRAESWRKDSTRPCQMPYFVEVRNQI